MKRVELVSPAGSYEKLCFALHYGADAVYLGGEQFSLRSRAENFTFHQLKKAKEKTCEYKANLYITLNIFAHNQDIKELGNYLQMMKEVSPDGLIISDLGVYLICKEYAPEIPIIISTQANCSNFKAVHFWEKLGAEKVCLARELTLEEIKEIKAKTSMKLEVFIHGAMCVAYSGRCLLSSYFLHRNSNQGDCAQPCRWNYYLLERTELHKPLNVEEDKKGTYFLNSKDLCMLKYVPELIEAGVDAFKIEGRMKSLYYVSVVTKIYKEAIENYYKNLHNESFYSYFDSELYKVNNRDYTTGFYFHPNPSDTQLYSLSTQNNNYRFLGYIQAITDSLGGEIDARNAIRIGDKIEVFRKTGVITVTVDFLRDKEKEPLQVLHPGISGFIQIDRPFQKYDILRKKVS